MEENNIEKAKKISEFINTVKLAPELQKGKTLSRQELEQLLSKCSVFPPSSIGWWISALQSIGWIQSRKVYKNTKEYWFTKEDMHYKNIIPLFGKRSREKKEAMLNTYLTEDACIQFLKEKGYKVAKPTRLSVSRIRAELGKDIFKFYDYEEV